MEYDLINKMKCDELKQYLRLRGLKVTGRKQELVARVFSASENNVKPIKTAEEVEVQLEEEYLSKLIVDDVVIPDPYKLKEDWLPEEDGTVNWPNVTYGDIFNFIMFHPSDLGSEDLSDYKTCKAYSYYAHGWLGTIDYHPISED